jgi:hypothetical protein
MDATAAALGPLEIVDENGRARRVAELWAQRPVVLLFVRHFG